MRVRMIILASNSKVRHALLAQAGIAHEVRSSPFDEAAAKPGLAGQQPRAVAQALALCKAQAVSALFPQALVIGADQTLDVESESLSKPVSAAEARLHLQRLRGRTHQLHSAVACTRGPATLWQHVDSASLTMRAFSDHFLDTYLAAEGAAALESVGSYKLEGRGLQLFDAISGDYFTILGLPLLPLLQFLRDAGEVPS